MVGATTVPNSLKFQRRLQALVSNATDQKLIRAGPYRTIKSPLALYPTRNLVVMTFFLTMTCRHP